ncbi:23S rRNA (uracil(1939)-C(5))-methyltransferase RlmD [Haploplasma axanthum]|uniref:tRNA (Uracil-5-)-methyltransferase related enzyme n=1 Tax=Haploplasma axanthum TaxID=29552 RepID=A0A449BB98_HAPAX|nr:23S rRNA (uracil(1939)-C(5))-methyltransferase RlmD [Haploplasma axanthum]VEU79601.1 tRNA (uracil-5-)-methyltransferase related enzyme [Haploplasma axanthum]
MLKVNDIIEVKVLDLDYKADGVAKYKEFYVYIPGALTNEEVTVEVKKIKKNVAFAELKSVNKKSLDRVSDYNILGSLNLAHLSFDKQLEWQMNTTKKTLERALKKELNVFNTITDNKKLNYRNKVIYHVLDKEKIELGLYKRNSLDLVRVDNFVLANMYVNEVVHRINESKINIDSSKLKNIMFKSNSNNDILVTIITTNKKFKGLNELIDLLETFDKVKGITINIKETNERILGKESILVYGVNEIREDMLIVDDQSFMQINTEVMNLTYKKIKEYIKGNRVIDAYSGVGSISYKILDKNYEITMIENNISNVKLAEKIMNENAYSNINIVNGNAEDVIKDYSADTIIVDPPRAGLYETFVNEVISKKISRIIYLSCDLGTLARDLRIFNSVYEVKEVYPIRMFPETNSFETLVILDYRNGE